MNRTFSWMWIAMFALWATSPVTAAEDASNGSKTALDVVEIAATQGVMVSADRDTAAVATSTNDARGDAEEAPDPIVELLYLFPKLTHRMAMHAEFLPTGLQDRLNVEFLRRPIIIWDYAAFEPNGLTNPGGKLVALKFVRGDRNLLLKPRDRIVFNVVVTQGDAQARGTWSAGNPDFYYRPPIVLAHAARRAKFQPGPATASAVGMHVDARGGRHRDLELDPNGRTVD